MQLGKLINIKSANLYGMHDYLNVFTGAPPKYKDSRYYILLKNLHGPLCYTRPLYKELGETLDDNT